MPFWQRERRCEFRFYVQQENLWTSRALRVQKEEEYQEVECIEVVRCCVGLGTLTRSIPASRSVQRVLPRFQEIVADRFLSENFLELAVWLLSRL